MLKIFFFILFILVSGEISFVSEGIWGQDKKSNKNDSAEKQEIKFSIPEKEIDKFTKDEVVNSYSFIMGVNLGEDGVNSDRFDAYSYIKGVKEYIKNKDTPFDNEKWSKFNDQLKKINEFDKDTPIDFNKIEYSKMAGFLDAKKNVTMGLSLNIVIEGFNQKIFDKALEITYEKKEEINKKFEIINKENLKRINNKYLIENGKNKDVKSLPSGLQYKIIKEGTGDLVKEEDSLKINYIASSIDGDEISNSISSGSVFEVSPATCLIEGWREILKLMKKGSKFRVLIPENLAYGESRITGVDYFSTLIFEIEVVDIIKNPKSDSKSSSIIEFSKTVSDSIDKYGTVGPPIKQIVKGESDDILKAASILILWDGNSKFANIMFKHNERWYLAGGFVGGLMEFVRDEIKMDGGLVVFVTSSDAPFGKTEYGASYAGVIKMFSKLPCVFKFAYYKSDKLKKNPEYRDYYDTDNKKIFYKDY